MLHLLLFPASDAVTGVLVMEGKPVHLLLMSSSAALYKRGKRTTCILTGISLPHIRIPAIAAPGSR